MMIQLMSQDHSDVSAWAPGRMNYQLSSSNFQKSYNFDTGDNVQVDFPLGTSTWIEPYHRDSTPYTLMAGSFLYVCVYDTNYHPITDRDLLVLAVRPGGYDIEGYMDGSGNITFTINQDVDSDPRNSKLLSNPGIIYNGEYLTLFYIYV